MSEPRTPARILAALRGSARPLALHEVAREVDLSSPAVLRHLVRLADQGLVRRQGQAKGTSYEAASRLAIHWQEAVRNPLSGEQHWLALDWQARAVDWRFPLLSRIADAAAYETLLRFFHLADARGLLHPWLKPPTARSKERRTLMRFDEYLERLSRPRQAEGISFVVFGSCARGDARPGSDVDLAIIGPSEGLQASGEERAEFLRWFGYQDLASEVNLGSPRGIGPLILTWNQLVNLPDRMMRDAILRDAVTVYATSDGAGFAEAAAP